MVQDENQSLLPASGQMYSRLSQIANLKSSPSRLAKFAEDEGPNKTKAQKEWMMVIESLVCLTQTKWDGMDHLFDANAMALAVQTFRDKTTNYFKYAVEVSKISFQL